MLGPSITPSGRSATARRIAEIGEVGRESALVEELERSMHALRQCLGPAADEERREEHVAVVDQPRPERLGREALPAHDQIAYAKRPWRRPRAAIRTGPLPMLQPLARSSR
jgi:hypothetical protein